MGIKLININPVNLARAKTDVDPGKYIFYKSL